MVVFIRAALRKVLRAAAAAATSTVILGLYVFVVCNESERFQYEWRKKKNWKSHTPSAASTTVIEFTDFDDEFSELMLVPGQYLYMY